MLEILRKTSIRDAIAYLAILTYPALTLTVQGGINGAMAVIALLSIGTLWGARKSVRKIAPDLQNPIIAGLAQEEQQKLQAQVAGFEEAELRRILKLFLEAENRMKYSSIPQLPLELAIIEAIGPKE